MRSLIAPTVGFALAACAAQGPAPSRPLELSRADRIAILQGCEPRLSDAVLSDARSWTLGSDRNQDHQDLWAFFNEEPPEAASRILIYLSAYHHTRDDWSTVATLADDGVWHVAQRGRTSSGMMTIDAGLQAPRTWRLSAADSATLTSLLDNPCVAAEPPYVADLRQPPNPGSGGWTLEIETSELTRHASGHNGWHGQSSLIANLLYADRP